MEKFKEHIDKSKEEIEVQIRYLSEENTNLRQRIEVGERSKKLLGKNECRLTELMDAYLGMEAKTIISIADYETLKREMKRADSLYEVQHDLKELKDLISRSGYKMDQKEIFRILNNVDESIEEEME